MAEPELPPEVKQAQLLYSQEQIKPEVAPSANREPTTEEPLVSDQLAGHVERLLIFHFVEVIDELCRVF